MATDAFGKTISNPFQPSLPQSKPNPLTNPPNPFNLPPSSPYYPKNPFQPSGGGGSSSSTPRRELGGPSPSGGGTSQEEAYNPTAPNPNLPKSISAQVLTGKQTTENSINTYRPLEKNQIYGNEWYNQPSSQFKRGTISPNQSPFITYGEQQSTIDLNRRVQVENIKAGYSIDLGNYQAGLQEDINAGGDYEKNLGLLSTKTSEVNTAMNVDIGNINYGYDVVNPNLDIKEIGMGVINSFPPIAFANALKGVQESPDYYAYSTGSTKVYDVGYARNPLQFENTPEVNMNLGYGIVGGGLLFATTIPNLSKGILSAQLENIGTKPFNFNELRIGEGEQLSILKGTRVDRGITQNLEITGKIVKEGDNQFIIPSSTGKITTEGMFDWTLAKNPLGTKILGEQTFQLGAKGTAIPLTEDMGLAISKVNMIPKTEASFLFETGTRYGTGGIDNAFLQMSKNIKLVEGTPIKDIGFGISKNIGENTFQSMGGRLRNVDIEFAPSGKISNVNLKGTFDAFGTTKIISKESFLSDTGGIFDMGGSTPKIFTGGTIQEQSFLSGVSGAVKTETPQIFSSTKLDLIGKTRTMSTQDIKQTTSQMSMRSFSLRSGLSLSPMQMDLTQTKQREGLVSLPGSLEFPGLRQRDFQMPILNQMTNQVTPQKTKQLSSLIFPAANVPALGLGFGLPLGKFYFPPFKLPNLGLGSGRKGRGFNLRRNFAYAPSIGAVLKGYTAPKLTSGIKFAEMSGIFGRPMITGSRRKKSRKKKK